MRAAPIILIALLGGHALAEDRPLPDRQAFLEQARARLQSDEERQSEYAYVETRTDLALDDANTWTPESVKVFESYPGLPGQPRWSRLVSVDGAPVPAADLRKQDLERRKKVMEYARRRERETDGDRRDRAREREEARRETEAMIDDAFRVYDLRMLGRESIEGHDTIVFSLTPRPGAKPRTREGRMMQRFAGRAWASETDHEVVRLEVEAVDTVSIGLGFLARVHEGTRAVIQRRKIGGEWLPASTSYTFSARMMLVKRMRRSATSEFSGYRKFSVATDTTYIGPKTP